VSYTTAALVKAYLGIPSAESSQDTAIAAAVDAADESVDGMCNASFGSTTAARVYRPATRSVVITDPFYTLSGLAVRTDTANDGAFPNLLTLTDDYIVEGNLAPFHTIRAVSGSFPTYSSERPTVQVTASYGDQLSTGVPYAVQQASLILAARYYQRRSSPLGITTGFQDWGPMRISRSDPDVALLLQRYRVFATA